MLGNENRREVSIPDLQRKKELGIPITALGVFDSPTAAIADQIGIDLPIIGDAGGITLLGHKRMEDIEVDEMACMTRAVARGTRYGLVVTDMPFMSYHASTEEAIRNAVKFLKAGAGAVKCEGDRHIAYRYVEPMVKAGISVMAHIGVQGFRKAALGYKVMGKTAARALELIADAKAMVETGVFAVLCEFMTTEVVGYLRRTLPVPVISLGSGVDADGQYLISSDMLNMNGKTFQPPHVKVYADVSAVVEGAIRAYHDDVVNRRFPGPENTFTMPAQERAKLAEALGDALIVS